MIKIIEKIKSKNRREQFFPSLFSFIFNPYFFNRRAIYKGIKTHAKKLGGDLLDFGCGTKAYKELFNTKSYVGIDLTENEGHELPSEHVDVFYDGKKLPFQDDNFDSIYSSEVFEHVFNLEEILLDINRVHRKGGLILLTMPFVWHEHEMPNDFGRYTSSGIRSILKKCNYQIVDHKKSPSYFLSVMQLFAAYIHHTVLPKSDSFKFILAPFIIFPINFFAFIMNFLLPKNYDLFLSHTILAKNIKTSAIKQ